MATIYNSDLSKELTDGAKIQTSRDSIPTQLAEKVVPVMEVNPRLLKPLEIVRRATASNATSTTIYTTPATMDFYIIGAAISHIQDATSTNTLSSINFTLNGVVRELLTISDITLTAGRGVNSISLSHPIKVDRNTTINVTNSTAVANVLTHGIIYGYLDAASNA